MIAVEGQDLPAHARLKNVTIDHSILPTSKGGGRMLNESDIGKPHVVISTKIAGDYPNADGSPKKVGQTIRLGSQDFTIVGLYDTGSLVIDSTIVMDIGMARKLLGLGPNAVSTLTSSRRPPPKPTPWPSGSSRPCRGSGSSGSRSST